MYFKGGDYTNKEANLKKSIAELEDALKNERKTFESNTHTNVSRKKLEYKRLEYFNEYLRHLKELLHNMRKQNVVKSPTRSRSRTRNMSRKASRNNK